MKKPSLTARMTAQFFEAVLRGFYYYHHRKEHRKFVVLGNRQVGIGNRIIALANMYSWAGKDNISLVWGLDDWVPTPFDELFQMSDAPGFVSVCRPRHRWSREMQIPTMPKGPTDYWQFWVPPVWRVGLRSGKVEANEEAVFCRYNDVPEWAKDIYGGFFRQLEPSEEVKKRISECHLPADIVCVQCRQSNRPNDCTVVALFESVIAALKKYDSSQMFFVSCMEKEVSEKLKAVFGNRILELPNKNYRSMVDAVADMWLLGGGREMVCQWGSTFPEVAWWWRGCKAKVIALKGEYQRVPYL